MIMPRSWFDKDGCAEGLKKLRAYKRQWNEQMGIWRAEPVHDSASHSADAFGTGVQGSTDPENESRPKIAPYISRALLVSQTGGAWMAR